MALRLVKPMTSKRIAQFLLGPLAISLLPVLSFAQMPVGLAQDEIGPVTPQSLTDWERFKNLAESEFGYDHPYTLNVLDHLATLYIRQGLFGKAEPMIERVLSLREEALGAYHPSVVKSLNNFAFLYHQLGLYGQAKSLYERALSVSEKSLGADHPSTATSLNGLASVYEKQGLYGMAEPLYLRAIAINERALGVDHPRVHGGLVNLANLYLKQGYLGKAEPPLRRSLASLERVLGVDHPWSIKTLNNLAYLYSLRGSYGKAKPLFQRALELNEKVVGTDHLDAITSRNNLIMLYIYQGLYGNAEPLLLRSITSLSRLIQREAPFLARSDRPVFLAALDGPYEIAYSLLSGRPLGVKLALFSRLNRQGLLQEIEKRQSQLASLPGEQQQVAEELRALTQQLSSLTIKPDQRKALRQRQEKLEKQLYRLLPQFEPRVVEVQQVAAALPSDGVLIEFQRYQPFDGTKPESDRWGVARYMAMVLKPNGTVSVVDLGDAAVLEEAITDAVTTARDALEDLDQKFELVSQLLLKPLQQATAGAKTWFVSPDGELNRLPFAALQVPGGKGYLAEAVDLRLLTTGRELLDLQQPKPSAKSAALVVADPAYDRSGSSVSTAVASKDRDGSSDGRKRSSDLPEQLKWDPLPATAQEGETVKALTGGSLLVQQQATAESVKAAPAPKILHLATHAFYLPNQPQQQPENGGGLLDLRGSGGVVQTKSLQGESPLLRSGIALAGANQPDADPQDDGYLTALEVAQLSWEGTDLVVISACESGLGDLQVGEGVYGLKRSIAVAGARSSLLSLWKVDDSATAAFMKSFYQRLKQGKGKADALAQTQKEFRNHPIPMWREPYVWAAFQLSGDWGPVKGL